MSTTEVQRICLIGVGTIGISFAALHLRYSTATVTVYDPRPDLEQHVSSVLPGYIDSEDPALSVESLRSTGRLRICSSLEEACKDATIVQEQGPERLEFKQPLWQQIEGFVSPETHMWSSTSGITASLQTQGMTDRTRLLVVHPFNPPHIMPLIEIVPSPNTKPSEVNFVRNYFETLGSGHRPVVIHKEVAGFVGNRLAFTLFREACYLVSEGVVSAKDLDTLMEASLGPRWAMQGPFKSYNMSGSGIGSFLTGLSGTIQNVWNDSVPINYGEMTSTASTEHWEDIVTKQTMDAYGPPNPARYAIRDAGLRKVLEAQEEIRKMSTQQK